MDVTREYGYREIPDGLYPAKGGESSLLFDRDGNLAGHAPFHPTDGDEPSETQLNDERGPASSALVVLAAGAAVVALTLGARKVLRLARNRRLAAVDHVLGEDAEVGAPVDATGDAEIDPQDALVADVLALCDETGAAMRAYRDRRLEPLEEPDDDDASRAQRAEQG